MAERARSIADMESRMRNFISEAGIEHARAFRPRPGDVIVATYPKAGTTWMQQIVHALRTRGDMDFREITEVTPWIELAYDCGWDLSADQKASPRAFKSHWDGSQVPPGCRSVAVIRDPRDTLLSFYNFFNGWVLEKDSVGLDDFCDWVIDRGPPFSNYHVHLLSWWRRRHDPDVLPIAYEDMKADLPGAVRRAARFIGLGDDEAAIAIAVRNAGFDFMKAHEHKFDDNVLFSKRNPALGLPPDAATSKVKTGTVGGHKARLSPRILARLDDAWRRIVEPETGMPDYDALRAALTRPA